MLQQQVQSLLKCCIIRCFFCITEAYRSCITEVLFFCRKAVVVGAGYIAVELAGILAELGSQTGLRQKQFFNSFLTEPW